MNKSITLLVLSNVVPAVGVLVFEWSLLHVLLCFWAETAIIGLFTVFKILMARGQSPVPDGSKPMPQMQRWFLAPFFCIHFGIFMVVHGAFVMLIGGADSFSGGSHMFLRAPHAALSDVAGLGWFLLATLVSHGYSFATNYVAGGERHQHGPQYFMKQPYVRVMVLHIAIMAGAFATMLLGQPTVLLIALVVLKTLLDIRAHKSEHAKFETVVL